MNIMIKKKKLKEFINKKINEKKKKKKDSETNRTIGGTFMYYIKNNENISKDDLKKIFWRKSKGRKEKKKLYKKMINLQI